MKKILTIRSRLFVAISLTLALSYTLLFTLSIISINRFTEEQIVKDLESSLRFAKSQYLARPEMVMEALKLPASEETVHDMFRRRDIRSLDDVVQRWTQSLDFLEIITIVDSNQAVLVRNNRKHDEKTFLKGEMLNIAFERRQPFITTEILTRDEYCREVSDDACNLSDTKNVMLQLVIVPVVTRNGVLLGALVAGDDLNKDSHLPYQQQKVFGSNVEMLITQQGDKIASTMGKVDALYLKLAPRVLQSLKGGYSFNGTTTLNNRPYEMVAEPLLNFKGEFIGAIAVALEKGQFRSIRHENLRNLLLSAAVSLPFIFLLAYFTARQIALPLRRFSIAVADIEAGDYTKRVSPGRNDEFGLLAAAFNSMATSLEEHDKVIISQNVQLNNLNEDLEKRVVERTEELRIESKNLKAILSSLMDGVILVDTRQRLIHANPAADKLLGTSLSAMSGEPIQAYLEKVGLGELLAELTMPTEESPVGDERVIITRHKGKKLRIAIKHLLEEGDIYRGQLLGIRDVTREGEVDQMKSDFIATVSHELKTPLTAMKGSLQFILNKGKWLTGVEREMLGVCQRNTERLIRLITDILDISRIEAGKVHFSMRSVVTADLALYALEEVKGAALVKNISIVNELSDELPQIYGDYDRLLQVFSNLMSNAVKFSPPNSVITVSAERQGGLLAISVADNGKVIKPSDRERLFTKFQHFGQAEGGNAGGSGLGLAISREIIMMHGGNIYYSIGTAGGNVFTFTVPIYGETDVQG
jgi:PAS domain S-box-containing protein